MEVHSSHDHSTKDIYAYGVTIAKMCYPLITILKTEGQFGKDYNLHPGEINRLGAQGQTGFYYVINRPLVNDLLKDVESNLSISDPAQIALAKQTLISVVEKIYELIKIKFSS